MAANVTKRLAEAYYTVEGGLVVLRDHNDKHITSRALIKGEDPAVLAKSLCEASEPESFHRRVSYPKLGLA